MLSNREDMDPEKIITDPEGPKYFGSNPEHRLEDYKTTTYLIAHLFPVYFGPVRLPL